MDEHETRQLRDSAERLVARDGLLRVRELRGTRPGFDRAMWREMAAQGWCGLRVPEPCGGLGLDLRTAAVLAEELARGLRLNLLPSRRFRRLTYLSPVRQAKPVTVIYTISPKAHLLSVSAVAWIWWRSGQRTGLCWQVRSSTSPPVTERTVICFVRPIHLLRVLSVWLRITPV